MGKMGLTLGTWYFFVRAFERSRRIDDGINYGLGAGLSIALLHRL